MDHADRLMAELLGIPMPPAPFCVTSTSASLIGQPLTVTASSPESLRARPRNRRERRDRKFGR